MVEIVVRKAGKEQRPSYTHRVKTRNPIGELPYNARVLVEAPPGSGRTPFLLSLLPPTSFVIWVNVYHRPWFISSLYGKLFGKDRNIFIPRRGTTYDPEADMVIASVEPFSENFYDTIEALIENIVKNYNVRYDRCTTVVDSLLSIHTASREEAALLYSKVLNTRCGLLIVGAAHNIPSFIAPLFDVHVVLRRRRDTYEYEVVKSRFLTPPLGSGCLQFVDGEGARRVDC